jgi:hypothetical protein
MGKLGYIRLLEIVYDAARNHQYFELDCDDELVSLVYNSQIKRTQEAQLVR